MSVSVVVVEISALIVAVAVAVHPWRNGAAPVLGCGRLRWWQGSVVVRVVEAVMVAVLVYRGPTSLAQAMEGG